jgi:lysozyme
MNMEEFVKEITIDEGVKHEVYLDHLGLPTVGVGHLITEWDEEYEKPVGTPVSEERVQQLLKQDIHVTIEMFNMGRPRLSQFKNMKKAVDQRDWFEAAYEMTNSKWCQQVPNRARRLIQRMQDVQT